MYCFIVSAQLRADMHNAGGANCLISSCMAPCLRPRGLLAPYTVLPMDSDGSSARACALLSLRREIRPACANVLKHVQPIHDLVFHNDNHMSCAAGGVAVTLTGHPFDTLKVRLQSQSSSNPIYSKLSGTVYDCSKTVWINGTRSCRMTSQAVYRWCC